MPTQSRLFAALLAASSLAAQEPGTAAAAPAMPDPKHAEHQPLAALSGDWEFTMKMAAMPGVPGMEQASESKGSEHVEMVCNGLWLKSTIRSHWQGAPFQGIWLAGYDPFQKQYTSYWVSSDEHETGIAVMTGSYDAAKSTWTWRGTSPAGAMRSTFALAGDRSVETCFVTGKDGVETQCMEIVRTRAKSPLAEDASAKAPPKVGPEHAVLHRDLGSWDAEVACAAPGMPASKDRGSETVTATCNGRWTWSDFRGQLMGMPFEGHALVGYDPQQKQYLALWIDSMSATAALTAGTFDAATKSFALTGSCTCPLGKPMTIAESVRRFDDDTRSAKMEFTTEGQTTTMEITYRRRKS